MPIPVAYRVDHLILTVGGNPLPVYVTARAYAQAGCTSFTLIATQGSAPIAASVQAQLAGVGVAGVTVRQLTLPEPHVIYGDVAACLTDIPRNYVVGLNYTAGTTPMGVHAYEAARAHGVTCFSYLDATSRTLQCWHHGSPPVAVRLLTAPRTITLRMEDLVDLHNLTLAHLARAATPLVHTTAALKDLHCEPDDHKTWDRWVERHFFQVPTPPAAGVNWANWWFDSLTGFCRKWQNNTGLAVPHGLGAFPTIAAALQDDLSPGALPQLLSDVRTEINRVIGRKWAAVDLGKWFEGLWLEDHVFSVLSCLQRHGDVDDAVIDVRVRNAGQEFQLDVACIVGYQLFVISCTTMRVRSEAKQKLFEVAQRARRLGGDEARVGVVTMLTAADVSIMEAELNALLARPGLVRVFGRDDVCNGLQAPFKAWMQPD
jgi:hypothetical protein